MLLKTMERLCLYNVGSSVWMPVR